MPAFSQRVMSELKPELKALRAELGRVNDLLADARAREVAATLAKFREDVALLGITEQEVCRALGYDRPARLPAKFYDPVTGNVGRIRFVTTAAPTWRGFSMPK